MYRVVENIENVVECIAVEHQQVNDTEVILFLKLLPNKSIYDELKLKVKNADYLENPESLEFYRGIRELEL